MFDFVLHPKEVCQVGQRYDQSPVTFGIVALLPPPHLAIAVDVIEKIIDAIRQTFMVVGELQALIEVSRPLEVVLMDLVKK